MTPGLQPVGEALASEQPETEESITRGEEQEARGIAQSTKSHATT